MTRFRKKTNPRLKYCKIKLAKDCKNPFKSYKKRPLACESCRKYLKEKHNTSAYKYWRQKQEEKYDGRQIKDD